MWLKIIFDKDVCRKDFRAGWGISIAVDERIIFDTGEKGEWLLGNMAAAGVESSLIEGVVISHDHRDHTGGLKHILEKRPGLSVYACPGFGGEFKNKVKNSNGLLVENGSAFEISPDIFVTGEIAGVYKNGCMPEQALAVKTSRGITILTGCSHPGVVRISEKVKSLFPEDEIYLVLGGFHMLESERRTVYDAALELKEAGVKKAAPCHCSGPAAEEIFKRVYGENFVPVKAGMELHV